MKYFDYFNHFWDECRREPFTLSEISMFHYLLNEANHQRWQMPIRCNTSIMCLMMKTSKQNIVKARDHLKARGIIDFESGKGTNSPPLYTLLDATTPANVKNASQLSGQLSGQLSHYNKKNKEKENNNAKYDKRRSFEVNTTEAKEYEGSF